jgi:hypothetical protein
MAAGRAIRSSGWSLTLLALTCCAAQADVLSADFAGPTAVAVDAGGRTEAEADAGAGGADASSLLPYFPPESGRVPTWTGCGGQDIVQRGRTGDACSFVGSCSNREANCGQRTALCADGVLHTGQVSKSVCENDDPDIRRRCAAPVPDSCCIELWQCESSEELLEGQPTVRVCALDCGTGPTIDTGSLVTSCPDDPEGVPWPNGSFPPALGTRCAGRFVCDSYGQSVGLASEAFTLDEYGRIYWCQNGVVQRAAIGSTLPWNTPLLP